MLIATLTAMEIPFYLHEEAPQIYLLHAPKEHEEKVRFIVKQYVPAVFHVRFNFVDFCTLVKLAYYKEES